MELLSCKDIVRALKKLGFYEIGGKGDHIKLRNDEGKTLDEIAEITGKPKTSIKSTLSSARKQLLNLIKNQL